MNFFKNLLERCREDKKVLFTVIGVSAAVLVCIGLVVFFAVRDKDNSKGKGKDIDYISPTKVIPSSESTKAPTDTPTPTPEPTEEPTPTPTPDLHLGEVRSTLDGSWISEEAAARRPFCAMLNNIVYANPQSGVGDAKILYEALVEGGITRLMGVYEGVDENSPCAARLGSIRSARHYYVSIATEYDAIYVHWGGAYYAYDKMKEMGIKDDLDGMYLGDPVFYRDNSLQAPHNGFFSFTAAYNYLEKKNRRTTLKEGFTPNHFVFNDEALYPGTTIPVSSADESALPEYCTPVKKIDLSYDRWTQPYMLYDEETHLYKRYQFGGEHIDYNTGEQLTFTNVIIQIVHEWDKDHNDYQDMDLTDTSGKGYYISMGRCVPITWKKTESTGFMMYYGPDGEVLSINPGKTFISVFPDFREEKLLLHPAIPTE